MTPTYSVREISEMTINLDNEGLKILAGVVMEEKRLYSLNELLFIKEDIEIFSLINMLGDSI